MATDNRLIYRVGDVEIDTGRRRVRRGSKELRLGKLTYELLELLAESAPDVVTREQVVQRLWGGRLVTRDTLKQRVKLLRDGLGDDAEEPRFIGIVRGHGYRLLCDVEKLGTAPGGWRRAPALGRAAALILAAGVVAGGYWLSRAAEWTPNSLESALQRDAPARSIAVLPFQNLSVGSGDGGFVDGIHNDLLTQLAKIESLKVISSTSVAGYREAAKSMREIARELGVVTVLEGSVQRAGDQVRINVQLIDAQTDEHLWAERYDRALTTENVFAIQSEMAAAIAHALRAELTPDEKVRLDYVPTLSEAAYNYYLLGNDFRRRPSNMVAHSKAAEAYEHAVEEDSQFALAWAALGSAYSSMYRFVDRSETRAELTRAAIERAFELSPDLPEAHFALGEYYYRVLGDFESALREWDRAEQAMPGDARIQVARAYLLRERGDLELSAEHTARAIELDPRNLEYLTLQFGNLCRLRNYQQAAEYVDRIIATSPNSPLGYLLKGQLALWRDGNGAQLLQSLDSAPIELEFPAFRWVAAIYERDYVAALTILDAFAIDTVNLNANYRPKDWYYGVTHDLAGRPETAVPYYQAARKEAEQKLLGEPDDARVMIGLADIFARLSEREAAVELTHRAINLIPSLVAAPQRSGVHLNAIFALVAAGDHDAAFVELERFFMQSPQWSFESLEREPLLDPIRADPRFAALGDRYGMR